MINCRFTYLFCYFCNRFIVNHLALEIYCIIKHCSAFLCFNLGQLKHFLSLFLRKNFLKPPERIRGKLILHRTTSKCDVVAKLAHVGCYSRWSSSQFSFVRVWVWNGGNVTHASFKQKGSTAIVRRNCGDMHIVQTSEQREMDKCQWLTCQSKLFSQKGSHTSHDVEWVFRGVKMQGISALIPTVKFSFIMISPTITAYTCCVGENMQHLLHTHKRFLPIPVTQSQSQSHHKAL